MRIPFDDAFTHKQYFVTTKYYEGTLFETVLSS